LCSNDGSRHHSRGPEANNGHLETPTHGRVLDSAAETSAVVGQELTVSDLAALEARWIDRTLAEQALLRRVDSIAGGELVGRRRGDFSGIAIPYLLPGSTRVRDYRLRRDQPDLERDSTGQLKTKQKYLSPPGRGNMLYIPPGVDPGLLQNPAVPLIVTEGEFKTLALWRLANWSSERPRFVPVGIAGVFNWRGTVGKANGPTGERLNIKGPIADLYWIQWGGRRVIVAFDADGASKQFVRIARGELARHLRSRGAMVGFLEWDPALGKGIDDRLASAGPEPVLDAIVHVECSGFDWRDELLRSKPSAVHPHGAILPVLASAIAALRHAPEWQGVLGFDEFACNSVMLGPPPWSGGSGQQWTDHEDRLTAEWLQRHGILVSVDIAGQAVQTVSRARSFHPVRKYLDQLNWDGFERLERWISTYLGSVDSAYVRAVGARWLISAVARICQPGAKADCCLILEGPQGIRKSTALRTLAGEYFTDELADLNSKDAALQTRGVWIIELSELDTLARSEIAAVKAFMSRSSDRFRPPYGRRLIESPRQCVFAGTVNHHDYLKDDSGGRRFWPVQCGRIDVGRLEQDRDQLWAEAKAKYADGAVWWLESAELVAAAEQEQTERYEEDPWTEVIAAWAEDRETVAVSEILENCLAKPRAQWTQVDKNRVARCLRQMSWERYRVRQAQRLEWRYRRAGR
jgi:hypothetical protein